VRKTLYAGSFALVRQFVRHDSTVFVYKADNSSTCPIETRHGRGVTITFRAQVSLRACSRRLLRTWPSQPEVSLLLCPALFKRLAYSCSLSFLVRNRSLGPRAAVYGVRAGKHEVPPSLEARHHRLRGSSCSELLTCERSAEGLRQCPYRRRFAAAPFGAGRRRHAGWESPSRATRGRLFQATSASALATSAVFPRGAAARTIRVRCDLLSTTLDAEQELAGHGEVTELEQD
jgi:hypothetical protein